MNSVGDSVADAAGGRSRDGARGSSRSYRPSSEVIYGVQPIQEALEAWRSIEKVMIRAGLTGGGILQLLHILRARRIPVRRVPEDWFRRYGSRAHQGVVAFLSAVEYQSLEDLLPWIYERGELPLLVAVDGVTDVRNIGAIARSAECVGAHGLLVPSSGGAQLNADAVKSSAGALMHLAVCRTQNLAESCRYLKSCGLRIVVASEHGGHYFGSCDLSGPVLLVMGDESRGVSRELLSMADTVASIPVHGTVESLNVSVAAGVLLYAIEACRQRG